MHAGILGYIALLFSGGVYICPRIFWYWGICKQSLGANVNTYNYILFICFQEKWSEII